MRVGFDARWYNESGVGVYVVELLRAMCAVGQPDLELLVYEDRRNPVPRVGGPRLHRVAVSSPKYSFAAQLEFCRRSRQDRLDLFHSPFYVAPLGLTCPVIVTVHDLIPFLFPIYPWAKQRLVKIGYRAAASRARHLIADSDHTAQDLQKILHVPAGRITTVHIAASGEYSAAERENNELGHLQEKYKLGSSYVVVSSARNWRTKNLEGALKSLQRAAQQSGIPFQTVVYGPPDGIDTLGPPERWAGLNLRRTGYLPRPDLAALFRHAHAFLMPSLYEGFGLPILEAMSSGCPVVTSNSGSVLEIAGKGAQVFDPGDIAGMAQAIVQLLQSPQDRRRWKASALTRAADFSWTRAAAETISVYHRVHSQAVSNRSV